jgi:fatty acid desaturase
MLSLAPVLKELERLTELDNWRNYGYIAADWLIIAGAIAAAVILAGFWPAYILALIVVASRMRALMNLVHQCSHGQLFRNRNINKWVGRLLVAWPLGISVSVYRTAHENHHNLLWDPHGDPKIPRYRRLGLFPQNQGMGSFLVKYLVLPRFVLHIPRNIAETIHGAGESRTERFGRATYWLACVGLTVLLGIGKDLILYWLVPYVTTFQFIRFWAETAEHIGLDGSNPWSATRNWTGNTLVRWIFAPHSDHWHLTHHLYSGIPHYRLSEAHRIMMHVPEYADNAHICDGLFFQRRPDSPSVIRDIVSSDALSYYKLTGSAREDIQGGHIRAARIQQTLNRRGS